MSGTKIKLSTITSKGLTYTATGASSPKSDDFKGELAVKANLRDANVFHLRDFTVTAKLPTEATPIAEVQYDRKDVAGGKLSAVLTGSDGLATASVEAVQPRIGLGFDADILKRTVDASAAVAVAPVGYKRFVVVGVKGLLDIAQGNISGSRVAASLYDGLESELTVQVQGKLDVTTVSYSHLVRPFTHVAGSMRYEKGGSNAVGIMGVSTKVDDAVMVKAKIDTSGMAAMSFIQTARANTKVILSTQFDVAKFDSPKVGLSVTLG